MLKVLQPFAFGVEWHKAAQHDSNWSHLDWIGAQFLGLWAGLGFYRLSGCLGHVLGKSPTRSLLRLLYADLNVRPDSKQDGLGQALPGLVHLAAYLVAFAESWTDEDINLIISLEISLECWRSFVCYFCLCFYSDTETLKSTFLLPNHLFSMVWCGLKQFWKFFPSQFENF